MIEARDGARVVAKPGFQRCGTGGERWLPNRLPPVQDRRGAVVAKPASTGAGPAGSGGCQTGFQRCGTGGERWLPNRLPPVRDRRGAVVAKPASTGAGPVGSGGCQTGFHRCGTGGERWLPNRLPPVQDRRGAGCGRGGERGRCWLAGGLARLLCGAQQLGPGAGVQVV